MFTILRLSLRTSSNSDIHSNASKYLAASRVQVESVQNMTIQRRSQCLTRRELLRYGFRGSLAMTFFIYLIVNTGMVTGLLPVVGLPLPLISYGGTSMVTLMAGFGMLMSIHTHRKLLPT